MGHAVLAGLGLAVSAIGGGISAIGSANTGAAADTAAKDNAKVLDAAAVDTLKRGAAAAGQVRQEGSKVAGEQKVAIAANGVELSSGSARAVLADSALANEADAQAVTTSAAKEAWGLKKQATHLRKHGAAAAAAGTVGAVGSALGSTADIIQGVGRIKKYKE